MKKVLIVFLAVSLVSVASAELVSNHDFAAGDDGSWGHMGAWGTYIYNDGVDDIWSGGGWGDGYGNTGWSNTSIWQDTGETFAPDTEYTLSVVWRDPEGAIDVESIQLSIQDVTAGWVDVATQFEGALLTPDQWETATMTFDTTANPGVVGNNIGVGVRLTSSVGSWVHVNSVSLVPEPTTMALLGLGGLLLRKRR